MQHTHQRVHVTVEAELGRDRTRAVAQASVRFWILETRDDGVGKPAGCRRVAWGQVTADPWTKPVRDAADRERCDRKPMAGGLEADEPEWLWPEAGHDEQIGACEERIDPVLFEPAREFDAKRWARVSSIWPRLPARPLEQGRRPQTSR